MMLRGLRGNRHPDGLNLEEAVSCAGIESSRARAQSQASLSNESASGRYMIYARHLAHGASEEVERAAFISVGNSLTKRRNNAIFSLYFIK
jgi:hypothetical protein